MGKIPKKIKDKMAIDPYYTVCALKGLHNHICGGRITREHAIIYAGRQLQEYWAIIPVCAAGQDVDEFQDAHRMVKEHNVWVALNRATNDELRSVSKVIDYVRYRDRLNKMYGKYDRHLLVANKQEVGINYA